jgi:hypothetical protein
LRLAGQEASGYYLVNGKDKFEVVNCNMDREAEDPQLQEKTRLKLPAYTVAFDATVPTSDAAGVLTYSQINANVGEAFNEATGEFVAPVDGVYHFSMSMHPRAQGSKAEVQLRVNDAFGFMYQTVFEPVQQEGKVLSGTSITLRLYAGDRVDTWNMNEGTIHTHGRTHHFSGHLLYPL